MLPFDNDYLFGVKLQIISHFICVWQTGEKWRHVTCLCLWWTCNRTLKKKNWVKKKLDYEWNREQYRWMNFWKLHAVTGKCDSFHPLKFSHVWDLVRLIFLKLTPTWHSWHNVSKWALSQWSEQRWNGLWKRLLLWYHHYTWWTVTASTYSICDLTPRIQATKT